VYVWARLLINNRLLSVAKLTLKVAAQKFPQTYSFIAVPVCDDTLAAYGTATADLMQTKRWNISF
jgi:hypothetical protein